MWYNVIRDVVAISCPAFVIGDDLGPSVGLIRGLPEFWNMAVSILAYWVKGVRLEQRASIQPRVIADECVLPL